MPAAEAESTPLLKQYRALKASYPHAVLFFRLGDFYEMFGDDARLASPILGVVLTQRQGLAMCGVPYHSHVSYVRKLLKAGHKVAIAEQMEEPSKAKGLVQRSVTRLITPGTVVEDEYLESAATNYLVSLELDTVGWGLACLDASTGEFWATQALNDHAHLQLSSLLAKLAPSEILLPAKTAAHPESLGLKAALTRWEPSAPPDAKEPWARQEPWANRHLALRAASRARRYALETQAHLRNPLAPTYRESSSDMQLDEAAIHALELVASMDGSKAHSLWGVLDRTCTAMGGRTLRRWILHPCLDLPEIERRLNCVEELLEKAEPRGRLREALSSVADLERVIHRLGTRSASPRDLAALRASLGQLDAFKALCDCAFCSGLSTLALALQELDAPLRELRGFLERALSDAPPPKLGDGGLIRDGFDSRLDELRALRKDSRHVLAALEERERAATGIGSLKCGYNSVFGYYLEVSKARQAKVPERYARKQTLTNAERYITPELKELEARILGAEERCLRLEAELFERLRSEILERAEALRRFAVLLAEMDALASLAEAAALRGYVKPEVDLSHALRIEEGRHPVVETLLAPGSFVPNSLALDGEKTQALLLTGPNMGGKSVFLRQNALIALMAQIGSFVPAKSAHIGLVDKILTRIGARDHLARGESTFMVEMRETAHILRSATPRSLVLLDEIGRGTSTYDGISIAWAVVEHLRPRTVAGKDAPRLLFATHYFELTELSELLPGVRNANVEAREWTNAEGRTEVVFLHKISPGPADRSFGIHVAELAGLPPACLARAKEILQGLENEARMRAPAAPKPEEPTLPLFETHPVLRELRALCVDSLTPVAALQKIADWQKTL